MKFDCRRKIKISFHLPHSSLFHVSSIKFVISYFYPETDKLAAHINYEINAIKEENLNVLK